ncbi:trehalase [Promicromonospora sp. AC04]|uniref:MGH1-like glycoside hydrolase domain-containing protein n=1 Tax=Promicromonospora sp. AC04 TaxID=2135723 RepID=UPI000D3915EF|nr:trehalase family glycosidase [Promicromonospora sp. AC04]PUB28942.1 trehalase [Promicromonospora sp. AC04]
MHKDLREDAADAAARVLDTNWTGRHTVPATGLYPHQWSWDSAFIAIGTRHREPARARAELVALLDAQWSDGRVPQIVYDVGRDDDYAPGPGFWRPERAAAGAAAESALPRPATSGLVQPPMHAWAAWLVHCADPAGSAREGFLAWVYPRLARWHEYLHVRRAGGVGLPVTKHPWETGTDNSPLWDDALERVPPEARTPIQRPDLQHAGAGERPGSRDYRRYYRLAETYRDAGCADDVPIGFAMVCPLFSSVLAVSELALARMAQSLPDAGGGQERGHGSRPDTARGVLPGPGGPGPSGTGDDTPSDDDGGTSSSLGSRAHEAAAARVIAAMDEHLWDEELGLYVALDDTTGEQVRRATVNGLVPLLLAASVRAGRAERMLATLTGAGFLGGGPFVPSTSRKDPAFDPALYWRGPAWFNMSWLLLRAVRALGRDDLAARLREHFAVAAPEGFPEYVDPDTGAGRGTCQFSWTAALTLDALLSNESDILPEP